MLALPPQQNRKRKVEMRINIIKVISNVTTSD
ncbi:hypothetical protein PANA5342_2833 [Pantoea ananatis LMG 5342]|nr:hypothetical protein PANA5342_2833 [Pantoea ananatis LMG 5342]